ncbi:Cobalamin (vitamin B12)-binding domain-containing protein [Desulfonema limicola]|uniref:Cobalamin (Vitamin B12)-binding domain-containing protein n=1 Tax=Desulfonema limicola TaxID=45656 RepID=A0A975B7F1_9BACT|nr:cobalamin-dependent protein [Desulfonema limicola]QTA80178.1 Cobalamin (vitamin B12)-binding domain-containing protein [Desulfonema limicola]
MDKKSETIKHINEKTYQEFFSYLMKGSRLKCCEIVNNQLKENIPVKQIYVQLFERALYEVGRLWEFNKISVATEHMCTAITESLMNFIYNKISMKDNCSKNVIISSVENEMHQVGGKMVADIYEIHGWNSFFLGANTPLNELIRFAREIVPDTIALSLSVYFHMEYLEKMIIKIREALPETKIIVGGQGFCHGGRSIAEKYDMVKYISSLDELEQFIAGNL